MRHPNWSLIFLVEKRNSEIVEDCIEQSYNNKGKPWKSSRVLRVKRNFFIFFIFPNFFHLSWFFFMFLIFTYSSFPSCFIIFHYYSSFLFISLFLFLFSFSFSFKCMRLQAQVSEFNERCFHRSRCSMEMWCPDEIGRDGWDWGERAFNSHCGVEAPRLLKTEPHQIVLLLFSLVLWRLLLVWLLLVWWWFVVVVVQRLIILK